MKEIGSQNLADGNLEKRIPVLVIKEVELPLFIYLVGKKRKMKAYCAVNQKNNFALVRCSGQDYLGNIFKEGLTKNGSDVKITAIQT